MNSGPEKIAFLRTFLAQSDLEERQTRLRLGYRATDACLGGGLLRGALHELFPAAAGDEAATCGFAAALAGRMAASARVLWLRPDFAALEHGGISALGLLELGLDPDRFLLLRAPDATSVLRAAADALSCAALGALVVEIPGAPKILDLSASRRLVLAAAQSGVTVFLLRLDAQAEPSAAETRWLVRPARSFPPPLAGEAPRRGGGGTWSHPTGPLRLAALGTSPAKSGGGKKGAEGKGSGGRKEDWGSPRFDAELVRHRHGRTGHWVMEWNCDEGIFRAADSGTVVCAPSDRPAAAQRANCVA